MLTAINQSDLPKSLCTILTQKFSSFNYRYILVRNGRLPIYTAIDHSKNTKVQNTHTKSIVYHSCRNHPSRSCSRQIYKLQDHVRTIFNKASETPGFTCRNSVDINDPSVITFLFCSSVRSTFKHACTVWPPSQGYLDEGVPKLRTTVSQMHRETVQEVPRNPYKNFFE